MVNARSTDRFDSRMTAPIRIRVIAGAFALTILVVALASPASAHDERPQQQKMMTFDADKAVIVPETGMIVTEKDGKLTVEFIPAADRRPKETADLDIAAGDEVGMAMGKKVATVKDLRALLDSVKPGQEVKIGLRRDGKASIATFKKMDPRDMPQTMVIKRDGGDNPNQDVRPALGVVIEQKGGKVIIAETFPNAPKEMQTGDVVVSINGTAVKGLKGFSDVFDNVEVGGDVKFVLDRGGKTVTVAIKRPKPQGQVIVK
jgi:S1-C subfamily serine protease